MYIQDINTQKLNNSTFFNTNKVKKQIEIAESTRIKTPDILMSQLSFMGISNVPAVTIASSLRNILESYLGKLKTCKLPNSVILGRKLDSLRVQGEIILLDSPTDFKNALQILKDTISSLKNDFITNEEGYGIVSHLNPDNFDVCEKAIEEDPKLAAMRIKGLIGKGSFSTAFLTDSDSVVKLSKVRNFPIPKEFIEGFDIPPLTTMKDSWYTTKSGIYVAHVPFAQEASLIGMPNSEFRRQFDRLQTIMKEANPEYEFQDFSCRPSSMKQIGIIKDTITGEERVVLLDPECVKNRTGFQEL